MKSQQRHRDKFTGNRRSGPSPQYHPGIVLLEDDDEEISNGDEISIAIPLLQTQDSLILDRMDQVAEIESHIQEVQNIFKKLSNLVAFQGEQIQRIEDNVDKVETHAIEGHRQLIKYLMGLASNRWLIMQVRSPFYLIFTKY